MDSFEARDMESVDGCPLCGCGRTRLTFTRGIGLTVQECAHCGLAYVSPRPTATAMGRHYEHEYAMGDFDRQLAEASAFGTQNVDLRRIESLVPVRHARVLDVGCGPGLFLHRIATRGPARLVGIEPGRAAATFAEQKVPGVEIVQLPVESADTILGNASFDIITAFDLLEHMYDPRGFIRWARMHLAPNGVLYIKTPNWGAFSQYGETWESLWRDFEHLYYFSRARLALLLEEEGLTVVGWDFETMRGGFGGSIHSSDTTSTNPYRAIRAKVSEVPLVNRATYRLLEQARRAVHRRALRDGTAPILVAVSQRH